MSSTWSKAFVSRRLKVRNWRWLITDRQTLLFLLLLLLFFPLLRLDPHLAPGFRVRRRTEADRSESRETFLHFRIECSHAPRHRSSRHSRAPHSDPLGRFGHGGVSSGAS